MLTLPGRSRVFVARDPVDMRKGFDGLFGLVRDALGEDPLSGHLFLFANRDRTRVKVGPYPNRQSADAAAAKLKKAGMSVVVQSAG